MRSLLALSAILLSSTAFSQTQYMGVYMGKSKIGYSSYAESKAVLNGKPVRRTDSKTIMNVGLLGSEMSIQMDSTSWVSKDGKPLRMSFVMQSAGRKQDVQAVYSGSTVNVTVLNGGQKSTKTLTVPKGGNIADDPTAAVLKGDVKRGSTRTFYVLDPATVAFLKNDVKLVGPASTQVRGKTVKATLLEINDSRTVTKMYVSPKGEVLKIVAALGIEMIPVSKAVALAPPGKYAPDVDLALATSLKTDKPIGDPKTLSGLKLRITAKNLNKVPSGDFQTAQRDGDSWIIDVHPPRIDEGQSASIQEAGNQKPEWIKPGLYVQSERPEFVNLARRVVGSEKDVLGASLAIQRYVNSEMKPNAGIGVLRNASEVLKTKEGVCRDYAILTTTLMRAAGIPARLASGIVNWDGAFYYHAWAEAWDGNRWIGIDSTTDQPQISAAHVKLGEGNVEDAFTFTFLDRAKIAVLDLKRS